MSDRVRALPSWMDKKEKVKQPLLSRRKPRVTRAAFYCMNERELVEAAVSCLTDGVGRDVVLLTDHKVGDKAEKTSLKVRDKPASSKSKAKPVTEALEEESSNCSDDLDATYVSESDLGITEEETLPYTKSLQQQGPEDQISRPAKDHMNTELEERAQTPLDGVKEDDDLVLVREIFFT